MALRALRICVCEFYDGVVLFFKFGPAPSRRFREACRRVSESRGLGILGDSDFYSLYGLYKQARFGDCKTEGERLLLEEQSFKRNLWMQHKGMSRREAMAQYISLANKILGDWKQEVETTSSIHSTVLLMESKDVFEHDEFFSMVAEGDLDKVRGAVAKTPELAMIKSPEGLTALHIAADRGYLEVVKYLIEQGSDVNAVDDNGDTPIHVAFESQEDEVIRALVEAGADLSLKNREGVPADELIRLLYVEGHVVHAPRDLAGPGGAGEGAGELEHQRGPLVGH